MVSSSQILVCECDIGWQQTPVVVLHCQLRAPQINCWWNQKTKTKINPVKYHQWAHNKLDNEKQAQLSVNTDINNRSWHKHSKRMNKCWSWWLWRDAPVITVGQSTWEAVQNEMMMVQPSAKSKFNLLTRHPIWCYSKRNGRGLDSADDNNTTSTAQIQMEMLFNRVLPLAGGQADDLSQLDYLY